MNKYLWRKAGSNHLLVDADGHPYYCEHCPCAPCLLAIEQRQKAKGITTAWSAGDPTNVARLIDPTGGTSYTLTQLKAYVNALCAGTTGCFIAGPYSGGTAAPTWLAATYANTATTVDELCALVAAMVYTRRSPGYHIDAQRRWSNAHPYGTDWDTTWAIVVAAYNAASWTAYTESGSYNNAFGWLNASGGFALIMRFRSKFQLTSLPANFSTRVQWFTYPQASGMVWDDEGYGMPENEFWEFEAETEFSESSTKTSGYPVSITGPFPNRPADPGPGGQNLRGWNASPYYSQPNLAVIEWDFTE